MINDHVNGVTFDDPQFEPFWRAAEESGAFILIYQARPTVVAARSELYPPA